MSLLLALVVWPLALFLALPLLADLLSLARLPFRPRVAVRRPDGMPRLLFLVPAHDEELLIARTIDSVAALDYPQGAATCVVVADNCTDRTADIARAAGATVLERADAVERGKPYAIRWALRRLPLAAYDAVVVLDADSLIAKDFAREVAAFAPLRNLVLQSYGDVSNASDNALTRMAGAFSAARFLYMNGLKDAVGLNVPLVNGTVFGTDILERHGWPALSITENWEMYALLTAAGERIAGAPRARNFAQEARTLKQSAPQRQRWAAGKLAVLRSTWRGVVTSTHIGWRQKLDVVAELVGIGPVVHVVLAGALVLLALVAGFPGAAAAAVLLALTIARHAGYALLGVMATPEPGAALRAFAYLPIYAVWRLAVQVKVLRSINNANWVRTARHAE